MSQTSLFRAAGAMKREPLPECHDGRGALDWTEILDNASLKDRRLNFMHDDILAPGVTIGVHTHERDEEYYYIVSGRGTMTLDGKEQAVGPGDITAVFPGGSHGLANDSDEDLRIIVFSVS